MVFCAILNMHRLLLYLIVVILAPLTMALGGCSLDWEQPEVSVALPERFREAKPKATPTIGSAHEFAVRFGSEELTAIVGQALENNYDIVAAVARIDQADATARVSSSALWPALTMNNSVQRTQSPGTATSMTPNYNPGQQFLSAAGQLQAAQSIQNQAVYSANRSDIFNLGLSASYEIDFWGKNEDGSKAARLLANASRFDRNVVEIATVASVLNSYFQVLNAQDRLRIAHENVKVADKVFQAIKGRVDVGVATVLDLAQQETVLANQRALIPPLRQTLRQQRNLLAVLLGRQPESFMTNGASLAKLRFPKLEPGLPSEVLLRRPDVAEAEAKLASQEFSVLQARAAMFPSITLT